MKGFVRALARLFRRPFAEDDGEVFRYVVHREVAGYLEQGWLVEGVMPGHHGVYSILMRKPKARRSARS
jgi:hypothetical protein